MKKSRIGYYDVLNIMATLSVIFLHCNGIAHFYSNTLAWKQAMLIEVICYWAVPIFFMLSGATLFEYKKRYNTREFFEKRFMRTVIPFIIWSLISAWIKGIHPLESGLKKAVGDFLCSSYEGVYWFFLPLFTIYLCIPVFSVLVEERKILWYLFITGFVLVSFLPAVCKEFGIAWNGHLTMPMMSGYLIYPILGYLLAITSLKKWHRIVIYLLGISSAILRYVMTYILSSADGTINKLYFSYTEYYALFLASAVFVFLKYSDVVRKITESRLGSKVIPQMASLSFGVYLSHMIIYRKLTHIIVENTWQWRLLVPFLIYAICLGISYCIRKIPIIKRIIP